MKTNIKILLALSALITFSGCQKFLIDQPESVLAQVDFFNTPSRINQGVIGCYAGMASVLIDEWKFTEIRSDNTCVATQGTQGLERVNYCDLAFFRTSPSLPMIQPYWYKIWQTLSNINAILPSVANNDFITYEPERAQYEGELMFLRAYNYYVLVNLWGDMFKVTKVISPTEAKKIPRSPVEEIYNEIIIPDLLKASTQAPSTYSTNDIGRVTKWAAKGLLAKVYMMIGGTVNIAKAKVLLEEIMASSPHGLITGTNAYANIFSITNEMNKEIIFAVRYKGGSSGLGSPFWGIFAPDNSGNTFLKVGTPDGDNNPTYEIMSLFKADPKDTRTTNCFRQWFKSTTDSIQYISKYIDPSMILSEQCENDWIVLRFADIVLLYAEVLAQDGNYLTAHIEVNKIRARAGLDPLAAFGSKEEALDAVYKERRLELAFENQRWFDLLRMAKSYNDPEKPVDVLKLHTFTTDWTILYSQYDKIPLPVELLFVKERLLLPIPQSEIDTNNEMVIPQNTGY